MSVPRSIDAPSNRRGVSRAREPLALRATLALYRAAGSVVAPFLPGYLRRRVKKGKEDPQRRRERFGRPSQARPSAPLVWIHAASVGETHAVVSIAEHVAQKGVAVLFTTGTKTAAAIVAERLGDDVVHQYAPFDLPRSIERFLDYWKPELSIVAEAEIWPNTMSALAKRGVPQLLVNARMSDKSFRRWKRSGSVGRALFGRYAHVAARTAEDAARFEELGANPVTHVGDLKTEAIPPRVSPALKGEFRKQVRDRTVWVAASTHPGEEEIAGRVHQKLCTGRPGLLTVIVPRHPERGEMVAQALKNMGLTVARRSLGHPILPETDVFLGDTIGEMGLYLRLSRAIFVGRSLSASATGGQNPIEPAMLERAVLHGPATENFRDVYAALDAGGGATLVRDEHELGHAVRNLIDDPETAIEAGRKASDTVGGMRGPLQRTLRVLAPFVESLAVRSRLMNSTASTERG